jgi:hypothetical protein
VALTDDASFDKITSLIGCSADSPALFVPVASTPLGDTDFSTLFASSFLGETGCLLTCLLFGRKALEYEGFYLF